MRKFLVIFEFYNSTVKNVADSFIKKNTEINEVYCLLPEIFESTLQNFALTAHTLVK